jgi:hypothetical protein
MANGKLLGDPALLGEQQAPALLTIDPFGADWGWPDQFKGPDFDAFRSQADFQMLLAEVEAKARPSAQEWRAGAKSVKMPFFEC